MVFLDHVQNLHIRAEKTHKDFGAHCMKYVNFVHDPEKQYRSTVPAVRPLSIGLQVTESSSIYPIAWYSRRAPVAQPKGGVKAPKSVTREGHGGRCGRWR
eukprot:COSAG05_NODE_2753_length_2682_cov_2.191638_1_plen_100_part_00